MRKIIIANWKSNKTHQDLEQWFLDFQKALSADPTTTNFSISDELSPEIVIAPSFPHLYQAKQLIQKYNLPIKLAAQNISGFGEGSFTGEVNGRQLQGLVDYVIIGHLERRKHLQENRETLRRKIAEAHKHGLRVIYCVPELEDDIPEGIDTIAYEPPTAIGSGQAATVKDILPLADQYHQTHPNSRFCYGGSVSPENTGTFNLPQIDGLLIGSASLNPQTFQQIIAKMV